MMRTHQSLQISLRPFTTNMARGDVTWKAAHATSLLQRLQFDAPRCAFSGEQWKAIKASSQRSPGDLVLMEHACQMSWPTFFPQKNLFHRTICQETAEALLESSERVVLATFDLTDSMWEAFSRFFSSEPSSVLQVSNLRDTGGANRREGHAVVITGKTQDARLVKSSWAERFGDDGFRVARDALNFTYGCGSKLNRRGCAGFGPCFHFPGFHLGTGFLSHSHTRMYASETAI